MLIIEQRPPDYSPAYNQQPWVVRETNVTDADLANWRMQINVWRDGSLSDPIAVVKYRFRAGTGGCVVFDPSRIVDVDLSYTHGPRDYTLSPWMLAENSITSYRLALISQYYNGTAWVSKEIILLTDPMNYVFNAVFDPVPFLSYDQADYLLNASGVGCLTTAANTQTIGSNDSLFLHCLTDTEDSPYDMRVRTYDYTGGLLNTYTYANPFTDWVGSVSIGSTIIPSVISKRRRTRVAVGTRDLAAMSSPVSFIGAGSYTVTFRNSGGFTVGQTYTFNISDCAKYERVRLHWLNPLGGFDAYTFTLKSVIEEDIERSTFGRQHNILASRPVSYGYTTQSRGTVEYASDVPMRLTVNSNHLTDADSVWMKTLHRSPEVYLEQSDGTFIAMNILNKKYRTMRGVQDGVIYAQFDLSYALNGRTHRG
jgi:hypothetical protein